ENYNLLILNPELAKQWHPIKNNKLRPEHFTPMANKKVWWLCEQNHEWEALISNRMKGTGCPGCAGQIATNERNFKVLYPALAQQWHPEKNSDLTPEQVTPGSDKKVWWLCEKGHEWQYIVGYRTKGNSPCPICTSLAELHPDLAAQWHPDKNGDLTPKQFTPGSGKKVWWQCEEGHEWEKSIEERTKKKNSPCPICISLAINNPELAAQWHPEKNGDLTPEQVTPGSDKKVWWLCEKSHEWMSTVSHRTLGRGCPQCHSGWTVDNIRHFVKELFPHLKTFDPAELYLIFQQQGLLNISGKSKGFVKALGTGRFPLEEIEKFIDERTSLVDDYIRDASSNLEEIQAEEIKQDDDKIDLVADEDLPDIEPDFPVVETKDVLSSLEAPVVVNADEEAVKFLIASAKAKIWKHALKDEKTALKQATSYNGDDYSEAVKTTFLNEYREAKKIEIPEDYHFVLEGKPVLPNLMQRWVTSKIKEKRFLGNWSGTGAGKTLSAVLASRLINSNLTVICCPNSVVDIWKKAIKEYFYGTEISQKVFAPEWKQQKARYLILNYEMFQQPYSESEIYKFLEREKVDFIVIDEIHFAKKRHRENMSHRRKMVSSFIQGAREKNDELYVLGMSATPVINNLVEGKSMVELVTGLMHDDLETKDTVPNAMRLHQKLATLGIRWMPEYDIECKEETIPVDCHDYLGEIRELGDKSHPILLEKILTRARIPTILEHIEPKTLIYTYYIQDIGAYLYDQLTSHGWQVGFFTGDDKSGLREFIEGNTDILIGTSAIGTGMDGLQHVCKKIILNVLPWTHAEYEQLKGRIYRQGQFEKKIEIIIPQTYAIVNNERWSWCESKWKRIQYKKSIADAAVDGVVPEGHLRSPAQAYRDNMAWLRRLEKGEHKVLERKVIPYDLEPPTEKIQKKRLARYGDFSKINQRWNNTGSSKTNQRLINNPEEWFHYHQMYREAREKWTIVPFQEMIKWAERRSNYIIGDFGCGEAHLATALKGKHEVYSFDHIALNDSVMACDIANTPLEDEALDVALFNLSLMGANITDYILEAWRTLKIDGQLFIWEATSRFKDKDGFIKCLNELGFENIEVKDTWKFTRISGIKRERKPDLKVKLSF
ncbi:zinc-ribbon domain-containing protein, partial [Candidatus Riflebacteria bacterium]